MPTNDEGSALAAFSMPSANPYFGARAPVYGGKRDCFAALAVNRDRNACRAIRFVSDESIGIDASRNQLFAWQRAQSLLRRYWNHAEISDRTNVRRPDASVVEKAAIVGHTLVRVAHKLAEAALLKRNNLLPRRFSVPKNSRNIEYRPERRCEIHSAN